MFVELVRTSTGANEVKAGVRGSITWDFAEERSSALDCEGMRQPVTFRAALYVGVCGVAFTPCIGGQATMNGVLYRTFGAEFLHIADLGVAVAFAPPNFLIPLKLQGEGTIALGRQCYERTAGGDVVSIEGGNCVKATVAFGYGPDVGDTYLYARLQGFSVENAITTFAPARLANEMISALPNVVKETGFEGDAILSFSLFGATSLTGQFIEPGFKLKGTFSFLGYTASADIVVVPYVSVFVNATVSPLDFGPFQLTDANDPSLGPHVLIDCGLGGEAQDVQALAMGAMGALVQGDGGGLIESLLPNVEVSISGRIEVFGSSASAVLHINNTHWYGAYSVTLYGGVIAADIETWATYGNIDALEFHIAGRIEVGDIAKAAMQLLKSAIQGVADLVDLLFGEDGALAVLGDALTEFYDAMEVINQSSDSAIVQCIAAVPLAISNAVDALLQPLLQLIPGCEGGGCDLSDMIRWFNQQASAFDVWLSRLADDVPTPDVFSLGATFDAGSGDTTYLDAAFHVTLFGTEHALGEIRLQADTGVSDLASTVRDELVKALPGVGEVTQAYNDVIDGYNEIVTAIDWTCDDFCKGVFQTVITSLQTVVGGVHTLLTAFLTAAELFVDGIMAVAGFIAMLFDELENILNSEFLQGIMEADDTLGDLFSAITDAVSEINNWIDDIVSGLSGGGCPDGRNDDSTGFGCLKDKVENMFDDARGAIDVLNRISRAGIDDITLGLQGGALSFNIKLSDPNGEFASVEWGFSISLVAGRRAMHALAGRSLDTTPTCNAADAGAELLGYAASALAPGLSDLRTYAEETRAQFETIFEDIQAEIDKAIPGVWPECTEDSFCQAKYNGAKDACHKDFNPLYANMYDKLLKCVECNEHSHCANDEYCQNYVGGDFKCHTKKGPGGYCGLAGTDDCGNICESGAGYYDGLKVDMRCKECPTMDSSVGCRSDQFCNGHDYKCENKRGRGKLCLSDNVCSSGKCDAGLAGTCVDCYRSGSGCNSDQYCDLGQCKTKHGVGHVCVEDRVCMKGWCRSLNCAECPTQDSSDGCGSNQFCRGGDYKCENKRGRGGLCLSDNVCSSGKCDAGLAGTCVDCYRSGSGCNSDQYCDLGRCKGRHDYGHPCVENRVCKSDYCPVFSCTHRDCAFHICPFGDNYNPGNGKAKCCKKIFGGTNRNDCCG